MYQVYQHWDPLRVCVVGRSYAPEFYSWIKIPHVRNLFEKIAIETEEDYNKIISKLESFGVEVIRPNLPDITYDGQKFVPPPMNPRDTMVMIGKKFYSNYHSYDFGHFYHNIKKPDWPWVDSFESVKNLDRDIGEKIEQLHEKYLRDNLTRRCYDLVFEKIKSQGNQIVTYFDSWCNGASVSRIGKDLYFGTMKTGKQELNTLEEKAKKEFSDYRVHVVGTQGHSDATFCPVCPGLIISLHDIKNYAETFPGWEVIYLPNQSWAAVESFLDLKGKNGGKWWIPGFEYDQSVIDTVETWLDHWVGYVEETVFDVNMLIIDPKNVMVFSENEQVFRALERYDITPHVVPFRHRYFWDGGIHCVTLDLDREGEMQDFFT